MGTMLQPTAVGTSAAHEIWEIDPAHTIVEFAVKHLMIATVKGRFTDVAGTVTVAGDDPATAAVDVRIAAASIETGVAARDAHLRSADFLDVEQYPAITFRSRDVARLPDGTLRMTGWLTIHGVAREVTLAVEEMGRVADPWGGERAGFSATTRVNRKDFGLTYNTLLEAGGVAIGEEVRISLDVELVRITHPPAA